MNRATWALFSALCVSTVVNLYQHGHVLELERKLEKLLEDRNAIAEWSNVLRKKLHDNNISLDDFERMIYEEARRKGQS